MSGPEEREPLGVIRSRLLEGLHFGHGYGVIVKNGKIGRRHSAKKWAAEV